MPETSVVGAASLTSARRHWRAAVSALVLGAATLAPVLAASPASADPSMMTLDVRFDGDGGGRVTSDPAHPGVNCPSACTITVATGTVVTLTAAPDAGAYLFDFAGCTSWQGQTCTVRVDYDPNVYVVGPDGVNRHSTTRTVYPMFCTDPACENYVNSLGGW